MEQANRDLCLCSWYDAFEESSEEEESLDFDDEGYWSDQREKWYERELDRGLAEERLFKFDKQNGTHCKNCEESFLYDKQDPHIRENCPKRQCDICGKNVNHCTEKCFYLCRNVYCKLEYQTGKKVHDKKSCLRNRTCTKCKKSGHLAEECRFNPCKTCGKKGHIHWDCPTTICSICHKHKYK